MLRIILSIFVLIGLALAEVYFKWQVEAPHISVVKTIKQSGQSTGKIYKLNY